MKKNILFFTCLCLFFQLKSQSSAENYVVMTEFNLYFDSGKSQLKPKSTHILDSVAFRLRENPTLKAYLVAYADSVGSEKSNLKLSQRRAEEMRSYLNLQKIENERMIVSFKGELAEGEKNLALNRKGRIVLLDLQRNEEKTEIELPKMATSLKIKGVITDSKTQKPIPNVLLELVTKKGKMQVFSDENGTYEFEVEADSFSISANLNCYFFFFKNFGKNSLNELNIQLDKMKKGAKLPLEDIVFVGDMATFLPEAMPSLARLLKLMQENPNLKVEIGGHINGAAIIPFKYKFYTEPDSIYAHREKQSQINSEMAFLDITHTDEQRFFLSLDRAKAVYYYLLNRNIDKNRITYRGYSGTQMRFPNPRSPEQEKMNRRVEITVMESECK